MSVWKDGTVFFPIVWHAHQPVGNFPWVIEEAYQKAYFPLLQMINEYPKIKSNLHISGPLLIWLQENHPDYLEQIVTLYRRQQIEIIGGGFFEPILAILPNKDKERQILLMNDWWYENYNIIPKGIWLAERVWTPSLVSICAKMGVDFTFIDDYLFCKTGFSEKQTYYAYVTEDQGELITIFPINQQIRYLIPWKAPEETIRYIRKGCDKYHETIIVMMSDMEKMGLWSAGDLTTHDICYVNGYDGTPWMRKFFEAILAKQWIKPVLISNYLRKHHPRGLIYLPTSSYDKMAIWSLPSPLRKRLENLHQKIDRKEIKPELAKEIQTFTTGSIWQNFLIKYSQANIMHKRMLVCRNKIVETEKALPDLSPNQFKKIWENVLASQSNDAYWHGLFGGVYYLFLRHSIHKHIIQAEYLLDNLRDREGLEDFTTRIQDVLLDGQPDGILENKYVSCYISSLFGGCIFSLNIKEKGYNFLNVLTRRNEPYHIDKVRSVHDRFEKWSFQDHFLSPSVSSTSLQNDTYRDLGDFANNMYKITREVSHNLTLIREGEISLGEIAIQTKISKKYCLQSNTIFIEYNIIFSDAIPTKTLFFSPEINIIGVSYPYKTTGTLDAEPFDLAKLVNQIKCRRIEIKDQNESECVSIELVFSKAVDCILFPLFSMPQSETRFEKVYQGTSIFPKIKVSGKSLEFGVEIKLKTIN
ncbi:MAG: alpha-amylase/4-alpha-glucanotransferase domain-containing protein [Promethearchaeota archaeon]